jgi:hypothetical protein
MADIDDLPPGKARVWRDGETIIVDRESLDLPEPTEPVEPVPFSVSDRQFSQYLAETGEITWEEHEAWIGPGAIPSRLLAAIEQLPMQDQRRARSFLIGARDFERHHPMTVVLLQLMTATSMLAAVYDDAWADNAWREASKL